MMHRIREGDQNIGFFHQSIIVQRSTNHIKQLRENNDRVVEGSKEIRG